LTSCQTVIAYGAFATQCRKRAALVLDAAIKSIRDRDARLSALKDFKALCAVIRDAEGRVPIEIFGS